MTILIIARLIKIGLGVLFVPFLTTQLLAYQQSTDLYILEQFNLTGADSTYKSLSTQLPQSLKELVNSLSEFGFTAKVCDFLCVITGDYTQDKDSAYATCSLINRSTKEINFNIERTSILKNKMTAEQIADSLAKKIFDNIKKISKIVEEIKKSKIIFIKKFATSDDDPQFALLDTLLPKSLAKQFNSPDELTVKAISGESVYLMSGEFWKQKTKIYVEIKAVCIGTGYPPELNIGAHFPPSQAPGETIADTLAEILFNKIVISIDKRIRIAISSKFPQIGDFTDKSLEEKIPTMLKTELSLSPHITLIETDRDTAFKRTLGEISKELKAERRFDLYKELKFGNVMYPNYAITGNLSKYKNGVWINVQCRNIITREIFGKGIDVEKKDINSIQPKIAELASRIRMSILRDILRMHIGKTLSVVAFPPTPNTSDNRKRTKYIIRAMARKLKTLKIAKINIKEERQRIESYIGEQTDSVYADEWTMLSELKVDKLLPIQYEDYSEGTIAIDAGIFDSENSNAPVAITPQFGKARNVKKYVNLIVEEVLLSLGTKLDSAERKAMENIYVKRIAKPHSIGIEYGMVSTDNNGPLQYEANSSFAIHMTFPFPFIENEHWKFAPMLTWDWGNNTLENLFQGKGPPSVHLFSYFVAIRYDLFPEESENFYLGLGIGTLLLRRIRKPGENFIHAPTQLSPALAILGGFEFRLSTKWHLTFLPLKFYLGLQEFKPEIVDSYEFNGGRLRGLNVGLLGISYYW